MAMQFRAHFIVAVAAVVTSASLCSRLGAQTAVTTGHYDNFRTGANVNETTLTPSNVNSSQFGKLARLPVTGCIVAQPLYAPAIVTADGSARNLVLIATTTNQVYAYDADRYRLQWSAAFGAPFPSSVVPVYN